MQDDDIRTLLDNYRYGVQKVIPAYLAGQMGDEEAAVDELALVLHSRDELEWAFATSPGLWQQCRVEVTELDRRLLAMRDAILEYMPYYVAFRRQLARLRSHWWYYLDEILPLPASAPTGEGRPVPSPGYWLPVVPLEAAA